MSNPFNAARPTGFAGRSIQTLVAFALVLASVSLLSPTEAEGVQFPQATIVSEDPVPWTPWVDDGFVTSIAQVGSKIIVGGSFTSVRAPGSPTGIPRTNLFSFDATTGAIDPNFNPVVDGAVNAVVVHPDGQSIIVGGQFNAVSGVNTKIAKISVSNGAVDTGFTADVSGGAITDMVVRGNTLFVGGRFGQAGGVARPHLAAFNATTGALDNRMNSAFSGVILGGQTFVDALDVTPDGSRMVVIGNFTTIDGQSRPQIAQFNLMTNPFTLANWQTNRLSQPCASAFNAYVQDVDYSPDGTFFALVTTGAFRGGVNAGVMCDTSSRWETFAAGTGLNPTWIDYAGGDTQTGVAVTAAAVYTTGHMRWENSPYAGDVEGPGAVARHGLAALDPVNGLPLRWDPTRSIQGGSFEGTFLATPTGLWHGTDVTTVANERHDRLAFFPLAGGTSIPPADPGTLPGTLFSLPTRCPAIDQSILHRVNAGGPTAPPVDCGPAWLADNGAGAPGTAFHNSGSNSATYNQAFTVQYAPGGPVPQSTPSQIYLSERWDPSGGNEMNWNFPVSSGTPIQVRVYLSNQCSCTDNVGERVFDVILEGSVVLNDYDIVADVGHRVGTVKTFNITSDGNVDLDFTHMTENPLVNAVEIVRTDIPPVQPQPQTYLVSRPFNGTSAGTPTNVSTPGVDWSVPRGAFMLSGRLYFGMPDGTLHSRTFNGTTLGPDTVHDPYVVSPGPVFAGATGVFFSNGSIYYTVAGDATMHSRYFTPESGVVGAVQSNVPANGFNWSQARGATMANGKLYWATPDGNLHSANFSGGAPQTGTDAIVSGPGVDGQTWPDTNGMFVLSQATQGDTEDPTAPGNLHSTSVTSTQVDMAWNGSNDNFGVTAYDIYRGGSLRASVPGSQTSFSDTQVQPGTFYSYQVFARDAAGNISPGSNLLTLTTPSAANAFADDFESGNLSNWTTSQGVTVQSGDVFAGSNAAMATAAGVRAFASRTLGSTFPTLKADGAFKVVSQGANPANLLRFQTAAGGNILTLFRNTNGNLMLRNDTQGTNVSSNTPVSTGAWHGVEFAVTINGASSSVQVLLDGSPISALTTTQNLGTNPIGRLVIGDQNNGRTFQVGYDNVVAFVPGGDTQDPTAPTNLHTTSVTTGSVDLAWTASTDNVGVTSYEIQRNGAMIDSVGGSETTYADTTVNPSTNYTYRVFAHDAAGNVSDGSNQINVSTGAVAFSDGFESGNLSNWTTSQGVSVQSADVFAGSNAAMATAAGGRAFASRTLASTFSTLNTGAAFKIVSKGANAANLVRFQTAAGANILTVFVNTGGNLMLRNDTQNANVFSNTVIAAGAWRELDVSVTINGGSSTVQVLLDGAQVNGLTTTLNLGTTPIGRLMIGDNNTGRTFQIGFDNVEAA